MKTNWMSTTNTTLQRAPWRLGSTIALLVSAIVAQTPAQETKDRPSPAQVGHLVRKELGQREGYQAGDLINQADMKRVLKALTSKGWKPSDTKQLLADSLPENDPLVRVLSTRNGVTLMRKVSDDRLIYDRMDRVSRVSGGRRMLADITKLPDGEKVAKMKRPRGVPGFLELLPKNSSGKVRSIKNFRNETGRIYTEQQLIDRLQESYRPKTGTKTR